MKSGRYRKREYAEAIQFENTSECEDLFVRFEIPYEIYPEGVIVKTSEGNVPVEERDWVVVSDGTIRVISDNIFKKNYEEA